MTKQTSLQPIVTLPTGHRVPIVGCALPGLTADHFMGVRYLANGQLIALHRLLPGSFKVFHEEVFPSRSPITGPLKPILWDSHDIRIISRILLEN